jgi:DNA-binding GntR family transcriptional regulator
MDAILSGELAAGQRINETEIAQRLGLSQTPVREALGGLEERGFLVSKPRRGFFVRPLSGREGAEIYALLGDLEAMALDQSGPPGRQASLELTRINHELASATDPLRAIELDSAFHRTLHARCPNRLLLDLLERLRRMAFRYEVAYLRGAGRAATASRQHEEILLALAENDLPSACRALRGNWHAGIEPLVAWLGDTPEEKA